MRVVTFWRTFWFELNFGSRLDGFVPKFSRVLFPNSRVICSWSLAS